MIHLPLTAHCPNSSSLKIIVQGREGGTSPAEVPSVAATTTATTTTTRAATGQGITDSSAGGAGSSSSNSSSSSGIIIIRVCGSSDSVQ